ncbi:hypothetical protein FRC12_011444 [Ceratobasidium sp. 428]|nr:hypothetical protein FRC12_011444 [Ceratobasidium sp. 428]
MLVSRPRGPLLQAAMMPLPGFSELQRAASSLIDDIKIQGYDDDQCALLSKRIQRLLRVIEDFGGPQFVDLSELSRELYDIKARFESESTRSPRFGMSGIERRLATLGNLREELSGLVEETQLRMLSRAVRANQAKHDVEQIHAVSQSLELQAARSELEHLRKLVKNREVLIAEKDRLLQILSDEVQMCQLEIAQLEEMNNTLKKDNGAQIHRWLDHMDQQANKMLRDGEYS